MDDEFQIDDSEFRKLCVDRTKLSRSQRYNLKNVVERRRANAKRRAKDAAPKWLTEEHHAHILWFYERARMMNLLFGAGFVVDHIIPLKHKDVCGLHVPWNMQLLTKADNQKKGNTFDCTYENEGWRQKPDQEFDFPSDEDDDEVPF